MRFGLLSPNTEEKYDAAPPLRTARLERSWKPFYAADLLTFLHAFQNTQVSDFTCLYVLGT